MILDIICLVLGFVLLVKGADVFVEGASKLAEKFHIPEIVIGLTVVAFGTSAPEAAVSITSAFKGTTGIGVGNIIGSNIANVLLILGVSGVIGTIIVKKSTLKKEIPFVIFITLLLPVLGLVGDGISFIDGLILWVLFLAFLYHLYLESKNGNEDAIDDVPQLEETDTFPKLLFMIFLGIGAIVIGSNMAVEGASGIASFFGVSDRVIGLTIVAIGTSLPELMTSFMASLKGKNDLAVGNIVGSNIFNILFVLGTAALVSPAVIPFSMVYLFDIVIALGAIIMFVLFINPKNMQLRKWGAAIMLICYFSYLIYTVI